MKKLFSRRIPDFHGNSHESSISAMQPLVPRLSRSRMSDSLGRREKCPCGKTERSSSLLSWAGATVTFSLRLQCSSRRL